MPSTNQRCMKCNNDFPSGSKITEFDGKLFHPKCFTCTQCQQSISELFYPLTDGNSHVRKKCHELKFPKQQCKNCEKVIDSDGVSFNNQSYHSSCFLCHLCKKPLAKQSKIHLVSATHPCCETCYGEKFAKKCQFCSHVISGDIEYLEYEGNFWHRTCFKCAKCSRCIAEESFYRDSDAILCKDCI